MSKVGHVHFYRNCWVQGPLGGAPAAMKRLAKVNMLPKEVRTAADTVQGKKGITSNSEVLLGTTDRGSGLCEGFKTLRQSEERFPRSLTWISWFLYKLVK